MQEWFPYYNVGTESNPLFSYGSYGENGWVADSCFCDENYLEHEYFFRTIRVRDTSRIPVLGGMVGNYASNLKRLLITAKRNIYDAT
ncbi:MAG: hypothetical protein ACYSR3_13045 [Planctomycetota bacterium]|jgi:hypothetical protein